MFFALGVSFLTIFSLISLSLSLSFSLISFSLLSGFTYFGFSGLILYFSNSLLNEINCSANIGQFFKYVFEISL